MGVSSYTIRLSGLDQASRVHLPKLAAELRDRRSDLGWALVHSYGAFEGELFEGAKEMFRAVVDELVELQSQTINRVEMGAEGLAHIVQHHQEQEAWLAAEIAQYQSELADEVTNY